MLALFLLGILAFVLIMVLLQLHQYTMTRSLREGFQSGKTRELEPEDRMTPEAFAYNILQHVKGPVTRLSEKLVDVNMWKERIELFSMSPVELARYNLKKPVPK